MNLGQLIDFVGNLLDYDPTNSTYREQLVSLLNDSQSRILTDRPWDFAMRERSLKVYTDRTLSVSVSNGSATVTGGPFPVSTSTIKPGSDLDLAEIVITDSNGAVWTHTIMWVEASNTLYLDSDFLGASGSYTATVRRREVRLPSDCLQVQNVSDPVVGVPAKALFLSKWEREDANLDPKLLGRIEAYLPSEGHVVPAPQTPRGVSVVSGSSQGVRTINVYMVNVMGPAATNFALYRTDVSDGFESGFSKVATYTLSDSQTLSFTPEVIPNVTGLYRRYYFTCPEAGILAPVRIRNANGEQGNPSVGVDTVNPKGTVTLLPDLSLATLESQAFQSRSIRYLWNQSGAYQSVMLYPHPSGDQDLDVRMLINPERMQEDQDAPLIPHAHAQLIAYAALESLTLKVDNPALSAVYQRKKDVLFAAMEQAYLKMVPRRIIKGSPATRGRFMTNPYGPLKFTP